MIFEKRIAPRLWDGMPVCLPCYGFRRQEDWEAIKTKLDELLPDGWSSQWGAKAGVLVLTQTPAQHSIPA